MSIKISESAAVRMKSFLDARGSGIGIRLGVQTSGCSGMAYVIEYVDNLAEDDQVFEEHNVKLIVSKKSLMYLNDIEIDFQKNGLNEGFKFINPNATGECGCGESFTV